MIFQVIIITHVPSGMFEKHPRKYWFYPEYNVRFNELLIKHSRVVGGVHAAHHHTDSFRVLYDTDGKL